MTIPAGMLPGSWRIDEVAAGQGYYINDDGHELSIHRNKTSSDRIILQFEGDEDDAVSISKDTYAQCVAVALWMMDNVTRVREAYEETGNVWMMSMWDSEEAIELWHKTA